MPRPWRKIFLCLFFLLLWVVSGIAASRNHKNDSQRAVKIVAATSSRQQRTALVIGNAAYQWASPLRNAVNDAMDIAAALQEMGFEVLLERDVTQQRLDEVIELFSQKLRQGSEGGRVGLFYFAGHGMQGSDGENYLVPVDAQISREQDIKYKTFPVGRVLGVMEEARNATNIIILDACRNNPFPRSFRSGQQGLAAVQAINGSLIAYATAPGSVAADGERRNGVYTEHLLRNMRTPGLAVEQLFKNVRIGVQQETVGKQTPWESSSLTQNFSFVVGAGEANVNPSPPPAPPQEKKPLSENVAAATLPTPLPPLSGVRSIYIEHDSTSRYLARHLEEQIREKKITVVKTYDGSPTTLKLILRSEVINESSYQTKLARLNVSLSAQNRAGNELFSDTRKVNGSSRTDHEQALQDASQIWSVAIKQKGVVESILQAQ